MMAMPSFQVYTLKSLFKNALECSFSYTNLRFRPKADYAKLLQENVYNPFWIVVSGTGLGSFPQNGH